MEMLMWLLILYLICGKKEKVNYIVLICMYYIVILIHCFLAQNTVFACLLFTICPYKAVYYFHSFCIILYNPCQHNTCLYNKPIIIIIIIILWLILMNDIFLCVPSERCVLLFIHHFASKTSKRGQYPYDKNIKHFL